MDSGKRSSPKQKEARRTHKLIRRALLGFRARLDDDLRPANVTGAQLRVLYEVKLNPGITGAQLARACSVTPQSAQAMMVRAVEHGWVVRGKDPENERLVTARLTHEGERLLAEADRVMKRIEAEVWAGVSLDELRTLNALLERGLANLDT